YRLDSVIDRNSNTIVYQYATGLYYPAGNMLVSAMYEQAHQERKIQFSYQAKNGTSNFNGYDLGIRLTKVIDPLSNITEGQLINPPREIVYGYTKLDFQGPGVYVPGDPNSDPSIPGSAIPTNSRQRWLLTSVTYPQVRIEDSANQ